MLPDKNYKNFLDESRTGKKATIYAPEKLFADFILKLHHENIKFRRFFRIIIEGFVTGDERLRSYVDEKIIKHRTKTHTEALIKERDSEKKIEEQFGLNPEEIEDIYDILEEELEDF